MPRKLLIFVCFAAVGVWTTTAVDACPLCLAPARTWAETIHDADVVVLAELISVEEGSSRKRPSAWFRITKIHRSNGPWTSAAGSVVRLREAVFGEPGDTFLLRATEHKLTTPVLNETFADLDAAEPSVDAAAIRQVAATNSTTPAPSGRRHPALDWSLPEPASSVVWQYVVRAPSPQHDARDRLRYFLPYLEHSEELIAVDAWGEFARAEYEAIKSLQSEFAKHRLRDWIANPQTSPERLNLFGLMLGMCGSPDDALFLREQLGPVQTDDVRFGTEGLMAGLLMLDGEFGLTFLEQTRLHAPSAPVFEVMAAVQAMQFAWNHEPDLIERDRLRQSLHPLLHHDDMREIVIIDLARWEDWSIVQELPDLYAALKSDDPRSVTAIAGFLLTLQNSNTNASEEQRKIAASLLQQIREDAPAQLKRVERQFR